MKLVPLILQSIIDVLVRFACTNVAKLRLQLISSQLVKFVRWANTFDKSQLVRVASVKFEFSNDAWYYTISIYFNSNYTHILNIFLNDTFQTSLKY